MANDTHKSGTYKIEDEEKIEYLRQWYGARSFAELITKITDEKITEIEEGNARRPLPAMTKVTATTKATYTIKKRNEDGGICTFNSTPRQIEPYEHPYIGTVYAKQPLQAKGEEL